ncbi:CYTH and CHAD domain-containing protein [Actinocorallia sp. API 0066]|uniref:CYTH and CHAD domain-containing protein n=1 Tax=Actinocorallia sp. API 0066 TaxID=2896846 RepID=UPI001E4A695D|nr:CYTH and CHAD domain-containing protein [Actinocorallia sp. API 0066]MCD0453799.1 CYTH and CHAD domain-containing protein [Actinocorallia sp. API 0066]
MAQHLEIELKFDADADFVVPDLSGLAAAGPPQTHELEAVYYDTDDLRLAARKVTLRRRTGGTDAGWHLKLPAGPDAKREHRAPLQDDLPAELAALVTAYARGAELKPVATLTTRRTTRDLSAARGEGLAELADDLVTGTVAGGQEPESWREIEVELVSGEPGLLADVGEKLLKAGARRASSSSKLGRLLAPAITKAPAWTGHRAGDAVMRHLAVQIAEVLGNDPKVRLEEYDAVHKMRVAVRRLRSVLASARPLLDRDQTDPLQPELRWLAGVLGEVRDAEVLHERFGGRLAALPVAPEAEPGWLAELKETERAGYDTVREALSGERYFALLNSLDHLLAAPPLTPRAGRPAAKELPRLLRRAWRGVRRAHSAIAAAETPEAADEARHETRKKAKRARYTADATREVLGADAKTVSKAAKSLQEVLGRFQDGVLAQEFLLARRPAATTPADAFLLGALYGLERAEAETARTESDTAWSTAQSTVLPLLA